jgi:proton glutamate symport protein
MKRSRLALHWRIFIALVLAVFVGLLFQPGTAVFDVPIDSVFAFIGTLFLNALKMLIVPLIMSSIIVGMMEIKPDTLGRLGYKTLIYYTLSSLVAILIGLLVVNLLQPGIVDGEPVGEIAGLSADRDRVLEGVRSKGSGDLAGVFIRMVPANIVSAAAEGRMLGLIFFSLLFGFFLARVKGQSGETLRNFWKAVLDVMMQMTEWVMSFAPIGVFALVAQVLIESGLDAFRPLAVFFVTVIIALLSHLLLVMPAVLKFIAAVDPVAHFRAMMPALLTAFSTSSSSATLPITLDCVENRAGVSNRVSGFTLPLGATVNMDGTALYECVGAMFIAQAYGLQLDFVTQFTIVLIALLTSIGVAGIPSASLVAITIILAAIGLPAEAIGMLLVVDRVLDMCRTAVNVFSDSVAAVTIARLEGEQGVLRPQAS